MSDAPTPSAVPDHGLTCPYCRFPVVPTENGAKPCSVCGTGHHQECWEENGGCAVALCAGGIVRSEPEHREIPERRPPLIVTFDESSATTPEPPHRPTRRRGRTLVLIAALLAAAVAVAGGTLVATGALGTLSIA